MSISKKSPSDYSFGKENMLFHENKKLSDNQFVNPGNYEKTQICTQDKLSLRNVQFCKNRQ